MEVLQRTANRGSVSTGYDIDNSLKLEPDNSEFLSITNTSEGSKRTATYSFWLKRTELDASSYMQVAGLFNSGETVRFMFYQDHIMLENGWGGTRKRLTTNAVYRDTSAFYHFVVGIDTTQSTAANRVKLYVNGVQETSFSTEEYPDQNFDLAIGRSGANYPWRYGAYNATYYKTAGYLAEAHYIDGTQYAASDFGEFDEDSGIWKPKEFTENYGTQGSYLNFSDASNLGANPKGSDIDAVLNNIAAADQATDTPTNNFCTWSPLWNFYRDSTITEGGTEVAGAGGGWSHAGASMGVMNGRWYWEWKITSSDIGFISFSTLEGNLNLNNLGHDNSVIMGYGAGNLYTWLNGTQGSNESTGWGTWAVNDIISIFLDVENSDRRFTLYKNGSAISGSTSFPVSFPNAMQTANGGGNIFPYNVQYENDGGEWNFGGYTTMSNSTSYSDADGNGSFVYNPVLGGVNYYAICTKNLAEYG
jgi:hypothetical protein